MAGKAPTKRIPTGVAPLDQALGGGVPLGMTLLLEGEEGAGSIEFAVNVLRAALASRTGRKARFLSALRSAPRITRELEELFQGTKEVADINVRVIRPRQVEADCVLSLLDLGEGDVLVIESSSALARTESGKDLLALMQILSDRAAESGVVLILLHTPSTVPEGVEASLEESADAVLSFRWRDSGPTRRRVLTIKKMRGLAPVLEGEQIPVFEIALNRGTGITISRVKSVI